jgi:hypothetical protein
VTGFINLSFLYSGRQSLESGTSVHNIPSYFMGTKCFMSLNLSCLIKPCSSKRPFALSCATIDLSSTSSPTQITNHPLVTPPILTNHTPPTNFHYWPQPFTFPNPIDHAQLGYFSPPTLLVPTVGHDHTPNLPLYLQHVFNFHLKSFAPFVNVNLLIEG